MSSAGAGLRRRRWRWPAAAAELGHAAGTVFIHGKGGSDRTVVLDPVVRVDLARYLHARSARFPHLDGLDDALLLSRYGRQLTGAGLGEAIRALGRRAGAAAPTVNSAERHRAPISERTGRRVPAPQ